jgi:hypothetical protein
LGFYITWMLPLPLVRRTSPLVTICNIGQTLERMA